MHARSEQMADYIADRLEFITFLACCSALLALLTGMNGQQALAFTALNLPPGAIWHGRAGHGLPFLARSGISLRGKV